MNAARGARFVLEAHQEVGVIKKFTVEDLERHGAVSHSKLLGEEDRPHAFLAQAANNAKTAGEHSGKLGLSLSCQGCQVSAVTRAEREIIRVSLLASGAARHERR